MTSAKATSETSQKGGQLDIFETQISILWSFCEGKIFQIWKRNSLNIDPTLGSHAKIVTSLIWHGPFPASFVFIFAFSIQLMVNKIWRRLDLNCWSPVTEALALPSEPHPLPNMYTNLSAITKRICFKTICCYWSIWLQSCVLLDWSYYLLRPINYELRGQLIRERSILRNCCRPHSANGRHRLIVKLVPCVSF